MQEQTPFTFGFVIEVSSRLFVWRNMCFDEPGFAFIWNIYIRFLDADLPRADGFDLRSLQNEASLEFFHQEVFKTCFTVGCDYFYVFCHQLILPLIAKNAKLASLGSMNKTG